MESEKKSKLGPIIYIVVAFMSMYWFYWFGAIGKH
jgi:hypothetical protein